MICRPKFVEHIVYQQRRQTFLSLKYFDVYTYCILIGKWELISLTPNDLDWFESALGLRARIKKIQKYTINESEFAKKMQSKFEMQHKCKFLNWCFSTCFFTSCTAIVKEAEMLWMLWYVFWVPSNHTSLWRLYAVWNLTVNMWVIAVRFAFLIV